MNRLTAIAVNTYREAIRDRILYSILFFAVAVLVASLVVQEITIGDQDKIVRGVAQGAISLFSSVIAMFLGIGLVWKELDRRTIYTIVSKPIPRWQFLAGKYLGLLATLAVNLLVMLVVYVGVISLQQGSVHPGIAVFALLLFVELMLLTAWATLFSCISSPTTATAFTLSVFVIGHLADDIWLFGQQAEAAWMRTVAAGLYWLLPNFEVFNVLSRTTHRLPIEPAFVLRALGYGFGYTVVVLVVATLAFQKRDFR